MSRCFPFPPPGYEKKPTVDDPDLLKKEKRKEKKHKKELEKKDSKEKREKDKSEGKHKDKKDKKDKHRDKKKDKEKSKTSIPDDKNIHVQSEGYNGEFPHRNGDSFTNRIKVGDAQLDRRIRDEEKGTGSHQFAVEGRKSNSDKAEVQKSDGRQVAAFGGNMAVGRRNGATPPLDNKRVDKMNERGSDVAAFGANVASFGGNVAVGRVNGATPPLDNRRVDKVNERGSDVAASGGNVAAFIGNVAVGRVNGATPPLDNRRIDKMNERGGDVVAFGGNVAVGRVNGATLPLDNRRIDKMNDRGSDVAAYGGNVAVPSRSNGGTPPPLGNKRVEKMQEKVSDDKRKSKDREKELEMDKLKEKSEQKKAKRDINNNIIMKSDLVGVANNLSAHRLEKSLQGVGNEGILKKRKAMETNGVSHENEPRPNKMARPISNISPENGRKLDFLQNPSPNLLDKQGAFHNISSKAGQRVNGMITPQPTSISAKKPPIPAVVNHIPSKPSPIKSPPVVTTPITAQSPPTTKPQPPYKPPPNAIAAHQLPPLSSPPPPPPTRPKPPPAVIPKKKPPHPDTKYLTQILSVPKPDPWCGFDDQEWLYSRKAGPSFKKPPVNEPEVQVWSEAKRIESVDVCALPYVIPY